MKCDHDFKISFIIPFQDIEVLKENLLKSFQNCSDDIELILVHDNRVSTKEEVQSFYSPCKSTTFISGSFGSPGKARNKGLELATGSWILFWDSDDFGFPDVVVKKLKSAKNDIVKFNFKVKENGSNGAIYREGKNDGLNLSTNPGIWRFAFSSKIIKDERFTELKLGEDILFMLKVGAFSLPRDSINEVIYEYRLSPIQTSRNIEVAPELVKFISLLVKSIATQNRKNAVLYGIYWRQTFSLLKISKIRNVRTSWSQFRELFDSLGFLEKVSLILALRVLFIRGVV